MRDAWQNSGTFVQAWSIQLSTQHKPQQRDRVFCYLVAAIVITMVCGTWAVWTGTGETLRLAKIVEVLAAMLAASGVILSTYLNVKQSKDTLSKLEAETQRAELLLADNKRHAKQEETFRLIEKWDDPHFLEARTFSRELGKLAHGMTPDELIAKVDSEPSLRSSVGLMLNFFDYIRISIIHNRIDEELIKSQLSEVALVTLDRFAPWMAKQKPIYHEGFKEFRKLMS
ncbi:hypothetical protein PS865_04604 [Pseudomonas fluorescens]|uniref:DUF4760 domain-containing protein n=1 Tax=Pseudomonas fluorescens TaxID=294 RepID=UPI00123EE4AA|nr:DUF4760 domain-containing protein [Pseudomonas fluorescens]VVP35883.1 hypothetical protein PS865_04604 [Pseudomonas fluorescens]